MKVVLLVLVGLLIALAFGEDSLHCGSVFDGSVRGVDVDVQQGTDKVAASWTGFEDGKERNRVLRYEWAVISENQATDSILSRECRLDQGFLGHPDVLGWQNADSKTFGSAYVGLSRGATYYVIVRATTAMGVQKYINSNGFKVDETITKTDVSSLKELEKKDEEMNTIKRAPSSFSTGGVIFNSDCPIDQALFCDASKVSVGEFLTSIYGPPEYSQEKQANIYFTAAVVPLVPPTYGGEAGIVPDDDDDDDDDDGSGGYNENLTTGSVIGIAIGITALCCFLVIFVILLSSFLGKGSDKFKTNVHRQENVEEF